MFNKKWKNRIVSLELDLERQRVELFKLKAKGQKYIIDVTTGLKTFDGYDGYNVCLVGVSGIMSVSKGIVTYNQVQRESTTVRYSSVEPICLLDNTLELSCDGINKLFVINDDLSITELPDNVQINTDKPKRKYTKHSHATMQEPKRRGGRPSSTGQRYISKTKKGYKIQKDGKYWGHQKTLEDAIKLRDYLFNQESK